MISKPIRILQVTGGLNTGGLETVAMNILRYADYNLFKFDFLVYGKETGDYEAEAKNRGCKIIHMYKSNNPIRFYFDLKKAIQVNGPYDIVYSHTYFNSGFVLKAAKACRVPKCIAHVHSGHRINDHRIDRKITYSILRRMINHYSDLRLACSKEAGIHVFGDASKFTVINNGIDTVKFVFNETSRDKLRKEYRIKDDEILIGTVGRLTAPKNQLFLIEVFAELVKLIPESKLIIVGGGELEATLKKKAKENGLQDKIIFAGSQHNIGAFLSCMDVFVFPSKHEGLGISAVEAQANGLQVFCSDTVPNEIAITALVHFISLDVGPTGWAQEIAKYNNMAERGDMSEQIRKGGFELSECMDRIYTLIR